MRIGTRERGLVASVVLVFALGFAAAGLAQEAGLRFVALGDMPYSQAEEVALTGPITEAIAAGGFPFVVHYGDFKGGGEACTRELFLKRRTEIVGLLPGRVFYTPGDNEWTDCDRSYLKPPVPELTQLSLVRELFFADPLGLPESWAYARQPNFPENARWVQGGVLFATVHLVSTNNGRQDVLMDDVEAALALVDARDHADRVWLQEAFDAADKIDAGAVVIVTQADVTEPDGSGACTAFNRINCDAFATFRGHLIRHARGFRNRGEPRKPVLLIHGDTNPYCWDTGFGGAAAPNLWRLNAYGDFQAPPDATVVTVQPGSEVPFAAATLLGGQAPADGCD